MAEGQVTDHVLLPVLGIAQHDEASGRRRRPRQLQQEPTGASEQDSTEHTGTTQLQHPGISTAGLGLFSWSRGG